jgi:hypothetical protein
MRVFKCFLDFHKEELWLAQMARQGYRLVSASYGSYKFESTNDLGEYTFKIDYRTFYTDKDFLDYCTMFEDSGWLHITGTKWSGSQYFVKMRPDAGDDIFSDNLSRAGRYKRISSMWLSLAVTYLMCSFIFLQSKIIDINQMLHVKELYYTPGLWERKGVSFWFGFLFETPFALMRGFSWAIFLLIAFFSVYFYLKSYLLYKNELKSMNR